MANNSETIDRIVTVEWDMFQDVNAGGPRADCQEDRTTFEGMRRAQFLAWSDDACASYFDDLMNAVLDGRNLVEEKYIHMMRYASPRQYGELAETIAMPDEVQAGLAKEICERLLSQTEALHTAFPYVSGSGRPLRSVSDISGVTSIETYQLGELLTYSENTLRLLLGHLGALEAAGKDLAREILENTVRFYGYASLEDAEAATKAHIDAKGIEISFGCACGEECSEDGNCPTTL